MTKCYSYEPMMSDKEIQLLTDILRANGIKRVLEWGCGGSTIYFPKAVPTIEHWTAVEHNRTYFELLADKLAKTAEIVVEGNSEKYIHQPLMPSYDLVLIDGIMRGACLDYVMEMKDRPIILFHDAWTDEHKPAIEKYPHVMLCEGESPAKTAGYFNQRGFALL